MKIQDILKKQGEIYKNLTSNKTIEEYNKTIEKPKPPELVPYKEFLISEQEYEAITKLEKFLNKEPVIVSNTSGFGEFEAMIIDNKITYLQIYEMGLKQIPKQINNLPNLQILYLSNNKITEIKNLDNLPNLQILWLHNNQITKIENLDNLPNLQKLDLWGNPIKNKKQVKKLKDRGVNVHI